MSESRIINVDYNNDKITYYYDPHEDDNELDIIDELADMHMHEVDYPKLECPNCNKRKARMILIDIYNEEKKN